MNTSLEISDMHPIEAVQPGGFAQAGAETQTRITMCERKNRYDKRGARSAINRFKKVRGRHGRPEALRAYPCPFCAGWHLTKAECPQRAHRATVPEASSTEVPL